MPFTQGHIFVQWTLRGELSSGSALIKKAVLEYDQNGVRVGTWDIDPVWHTSLETQYGGNGSSHIAILGDKMYVFYRGFGGSQIYEVHPDHSVRTFFNFNAHPTVSSFQMTFDSSGNMYLFGSNFSTHQGICTKVEKDTGVILQQWTVALGDNDPYDSIWLMNDDKTLLIGNSFHDGWEGVLSADLSFGPNIMATEYKKLRSPYDYPNFGYYFDMEDILVDGPADNPSLYLTTSPNNSGNAYDLVPVIRVLPSPNMYYHSVGAGEAGILENEDEGFCLDCDPDGIGIWMDSQSNDNLCKFNKVTGEQMKILFLKVEHGDSIGGINPQEIGPIYFAIAGGSGHHGCGCSCGQPVTPLRNAFIQHVG